MSKPISDNTKDTASRVGSLRRHGQQLQQDTSTRTKERTHQVSKTSTAHLAHSTSPSTNHNPSIPTSSTNHSSTSATSQIHNIVTAPPQQRLMEANMWLQDQLTGVDRAQRGREFELVCEELRLLGLEAREGMVKKSLGRLGGWCERGRRREEENLRGVGAWVGN